MQQAAKNAVGMGAAAVEQKAMDFKEALETWLKQKIQAKLDMLIDRIPPILKNSLEDPYMPRCASRMKDRAIDNVWPDVRDEIMWEVAVFLDGEKKTESADLGAACCCCRFFRYHLFPCDKSFWGHIKDPVFVLFTLVSLAPISGFCSLIFLFIFLIIDRGDEYQLLQFILQFKGTQFISHGVIRTLTGFFMYVGCVTAVAQSNHDCEQQGPGLAGSFEVIIGGWVVQIILVWWAFCLLPCSQDKGRSQLSGKLEFEQSSRMRRPGGWIMYLLVWDMLAFIGCTAGLIYVLIARAQALDQGYAKTYDDWAVKHAFYACQVVYGYLSMPFFFFTLPVLRNVLTHSVPTAYNRKGITCKITGPEKRGDRSKQELVTQQESNQILQDVKHLFWSGKAEGEGNPGNPEVPTA